jgi:hypothetical protein
MTTILPIVEETEHLQRLVQSMAPQLRQAAAGYRQFEDAFGATARQIVAWYHEQARALEPVIRAATEQYAILERTGHRGAMPILRRRGWFGLEPYLNALELHQIAHVREQKGATAVDRFICSRFSQNRHAKIRQVTKKWWRIRYMSKRGSKVRAALKAYRARQHSLSIPTLLPLVEGLAAAYFRANPGKLVPRPGKQPTILVKDAAALYPAARPDHADLLVAVLTDKIYARFEFGTQRAPSALNRHGPPPAAAGAILSGRGVNAKALGGRGSTD